MRISFFLFLKKMNRCTIILCILFCDFISHVQYTVDIFPESHTHTPLYLICRCWCCWARDHTLTRKLNTTARGVLSLSALTAQRSRQWISALILSKLNKTRSHRSFTTEDLFITNKPQAYIQPKWALYFLKLFLLLASYFLKDKNAETVFESAQALK